MRRLGVAVLLVLAMPAAASAATTSARSGSARASAGNGVASLTDGRITRTWKTGAGGVVTDSLRGDGVNWSDGNSPDFTLDLNGVSTSSTSGWSLADVTARR